MCFPLTWFNLQNTEFLSKKTYRVTGDRANALCRKNPADFILLPKLRKFHASFLRHSLAKTLYEIRLARFHSALFNLETLETFTPAFSLEFIIYTLN